MLGTISRLVTLLFSALLIVSPIVAKATITIEFGGIDFGGDPSPFKGPIGPMDCKYELKSDAPNGIVVRMQAPQFSGAIVVENYMGDVSKAPINLTSGPIDPSAKTPPENAVSIGIFGGHGGLGLLPLAPDSECRVNMKVEQTLLKGSVDCINLGEQFVSGISFKAHDFECRAQ